MVGIYKITNKINGKVYIGQSVDIDKRKREHLNNYKRDEIKHYILYRAINKYGVNKRYVAILIGIWIKQIRRKLQQMMYLWYGAVKHCKTIKHYLVQLCLMECIMNVHTMEIKKKCM